MNRGLGLKLQVIVLAFALCAAFLATPAQAAVDYAASTPWVAQIVGFIGGSNVNVRSIGNWDASGRFYSKARPRADEIVIALDSREAAILRVDPGAKNLRLLHDSLTIPGEQKYSVFFDPATLPFIAQSIMKILAESDPPSYSFYQRRLAEFQSRLDSNVEIGRHMLDGATLLDITGAQGAWVRAAGSGVVRPPDEVWRQWLGGDNSALNAALAEASRRGWLILLDAWTPPVLRSAAVVHSNRLTLASPILGQDTFSFLHDIFINVAAATKPTAGQVAPIGRQ